MAATAQILAEIAARAGAVVMRHYQAGRSPEDWRGSRPTTRP